MNTGHDVRLVLDDATAAYVNISGGPLAYQYRVHELSIHFGRDDARGSEHSIERQHFPAEVFTVFFSSVCGFMENERVSFRDTKLIPI